ncbi:MAG: hypothetical protein GY906_33390 [bacterium]|nr:hypothetical protein [bacterium]
MSQPKPNQPAIDVCGGRAGRRVFKAIATLLPRVLTEGEQNLAVAEAIEQVGWRKRVVFGSMWGLTHRVALVFTDRRLIEIALSFAGRRATGLVREFAWSNSLEPRTDGQSFSLGDAPIWRLRQSLPEVLLADIEERSRDTKTGARRVGHLQAWRLCPECGLTSSEKDARCRRCGALKRSSRLAALLALAFPGAGHFFVKRPGFALFRCVFELGFFAVLSLQLLKAGSTFTTVSWMVASGLALVLIKAESISQARALAERAGTIEDVRAKRWLRFIPLGIVLSLSAFIVPMMFVGSADTKITGDLAADSTHLGWTVSRVESTDQSQRNAQAPRARWLHTDGWVVEVTAQPFPPFEWTDTVRARWLAEFQDRTEVVASELRLGEIDVLRIIETSFDERGQEKATVSHVVFDSYGRDEHVFTADVTQDDLAEFNQKIQKLFPCMYWISARPPSSLVKRFITLD